MRRVGRTLYTQIAALYLALTLVFCAVLVVLTVRQFDAFLDEVQQRLSRDLAATLAARLAPELAEGLHSERATAAVRDVRGINPSIDIHVLDETGQVVAAYADAAPRADARIELGPLRRFLGERAMLPIRAGDPTDPDELKVFSVAPVSVPDADAGYLYVILHGSPLETAASMLRDSYIVRGVALAVLLLLASVLAVGLVLFALLTRRFRRLAAAVRTISEGDYGQRIPVGHDDEIGRLGQAVNEMASMIEAQVEALRRTDEARRTLLANLSHDFRTPLTSLRGYAQRLASGWNRLDDGARTECLEAVLGNTEQLEHMSAQLASLSLLDGHGQVVRPEAFSLGELVQDVVLKFRPAATRRGVALDCILPELPDVRADIGLIERVLGNLIDNALACTPAGGEVSVTLERVADGGVRLVVVDTGCGIAPEELPLVARRFYRTERGRALRPTGTGLGLAIAREILELHGAALELHSTLDVGSAMGFRLPPAA